MADLADRGGPYIMPPDGAGGLANRLLKPQGGPLPTAALGGI